MKNKILYEGRILTELLWIALLITSLIISISYIFIVIHLHFMTSALFCTTILIVVCIVEISFIFNSRHYRIVFYQDGVDVPAVNTRDPDSIDNHSFRRTSVLPHFFHYSEILQIVPFYYGIKSKDADYIGLKIIFKSIDQYYVTFIHRSNLRISVIIYLLSKEKNWYDTIGFEEPIGIDRFSFNEMWSRISYELRLLIEKNRKNKPTLSLKSVPNYSESWLTYFQKIYKDLMKTYLFILIWLFIGILLYNISQNIVLSIILDPFAYNKDFITVIIPLFSLFILGTGFYGLSLLPTERFGPFKICNGNVYLPHINISFLYDFLKMFKMGRKFRFDQIAGVLIENNYILFYIVSKSDVLSLHIIPKYYFINYKIAISRIQMIGIPVFQTVFNE